MSIQSSSFRARETGPVQRTGLLRQLSAYPGQGLHATGARDRPITPFLINSVVVGEIDRPQAIIEPVARKVQTTRENERKETELQLPLKS